MFMLLQSVDFTSSIKKGRTTSWRSFIFLRDLLQREGYESLKGFVLKVSCPQLHTTRSHILVNPLLIIGRYSVRMTKISILK